MPPQSPLLPVSPPCHSNHPLPLQPPLLSPIGPSITDSPPCCPNQPNSGSSGEPSPPYLLPGSQQPLITPIHLDPALSRFHDCRGRGRGRDRKLPGCSGTQWGLNADAQGWHRLQEAWKQAGRDLSLHLSCHHLHSQVDQVRRAVIWRWRGNCGVERVIQRLAGSLWGNLRGRGGVQGVEVAIQVVRQSFPSPPPCILYQG